MTAKCFSHRILADGGHNVWNNLEGMVLMKCRERAWSANSILCVLLLAVTPFKVSFLTLTIVVYEAELLTT